jgi:hypothetical protein
MTHDGQLIAHDPNQQRLNLRVMKHMPAETKIIDIQEPPTPRDVLNQQ